MRGIYTLLIAAFVASVCVEAARHYKLPAFADPPSCADVPANVTVLYPDPENCSRFYECDNGHAVLLNCPADLYYCPELELCSYQNDGNCSYSGCNPVVRAEEVFEAFAVPECPPDQLPNVTILHPDSDNCSRFYECDNGHAVLMDCPSNLYYCSELEACSYRDDGNCSFSDCNPVVRAEEVFEAFAVPECPPDQLPNVTILHPDSDNCSRFYECDNGHAVLMDCPSNLYYCSELEACSYRDDGNCSFSDCNPVVRAEEVFEAFAVPECPPDQLPNVTILHPDSDNCSRFYECDNGHAVLMDCPSNLYYCSELEACSYRDDGNCSFSDCNPVVRAEEAFESFAVPECPPDQLPNVTILYPDSDNCSRFYECDNGHAVLMNCPANLYYCSELEACSYRDDGNCSYANCVAQRIDHENSFENEMLDNAPFNHRIHVPHHKRKQLTKIHNQEIRKH